MAYDIGSILALWESKGVFEFVFPMLLIFAFVFGILQKVNIFGETDSAGKKRPNKTLNLVIGVVVALMSIQFDYVRRIMGDFVARGAVGILILIMMLILISMFLSEDAGNNKGTKKGWYIVFSIVAAIIFIVILAQSFGNYGGFSYSGALGGDLVGWIVGAVLLVGIIVAIATSSSD